MQLDPDTHKAHQAYINHLVGCRSCYAPTKRYCSPGKALCVSYEAHFLLTQDLTTRRTVLFRLESSDPSHCEALKAALIAIHEQGKQDCAG